jgi:serine/threonine-protein kinase HipA
MDLGPAYDFTYPIDALPKFLNTPRALSINGKRLKIVLDDLLPLAEEITIKNPTKIIQEVQNIITQWEDSEEKFQIPKADQSAISKDSSPLII